MVLSVWWLRYYSAETTYLKPSSHFLLHLNFDGGKKTFFPSPSHFLPSAFVQEPDWLIFISLSPQWHWNEPTLSICPEQMLSIFFLFFRQTQNNFVWPTGRVGVRKKSISLVQLYHQVTHHDLLYSGALRRPDFPDFFKGFLSSLHVCRQCFPLQIKYVSFAEIRVQYECVSEVQNYADTVSSYDRTMADTYPWGFVQSCTVIKV